MRSQRRIKFHACKDHLVGNHFLIWHSSCSSCLLVLFSLFVMHKCHDKLGLYVKTLCLLLLLCCLPVQLWEMRKVELVKSHLVHCCCELLLSINWTFIAYRCSIISCYLISLQILKMRNNGADWYLKGSSISQWPSNLTQLFYIYFWINV